MEFSADFTDGWNVIEWDRFRSLYIASTLSNWKRVRSFLDYFRKLGIPIAFDWTIWGEEIFTGDKPRDIDPLSLREKALCEYGGVASASYLLVIAPTGCGTNFEFGAAYQRLKSTNSPEITILDETESTTPISFHYLPSVKKTKCAKSAVEDVLAHFDITIKDINIDQSGSPTC
jgi:hypothetical protein